jgi:hypothetical protein
LAGQTQSPCTQAGAVCGGQAAPHDPQFDGSTSVSVQIPGTPQQSALTPEQGSAPLQKQSLPTHSFPDGAQCASSQQTPATHEPPQQTLSVPHCSSASHGTQTLSALQMGVGLPHGGQATCCPQLLATVPQSPAQVACGESGVQQRLGSDRGSQMSPPGQQMLAQQTLLGQWWSVQHSWQVPAHACGFVAGHEQTPLRQMAPPQQSPPSPPPQTPPIS